LSLFQRNFHLLLLPITLAGSLGYFLISSRQAENKPVSPAREALVRSSSDQQLQKFKLTGFDDTGKTNWNLEGDTAKIDPGQTVFLDSNVTLKLKDAIVRTDHVQWSQDGGTLRTHAWVDVDHETVKVRGRGATGRPNDGYIQLNRDIAMTIDAGTQLVCEGPLKIFYNDNKMYFYRKVKVTDARGTLSSNRMEVSFDPESKRIKQILAIGSVVIRRDGDVTRSQRAIYSVETKSIRLEGNPEITLQKSGGLLSNGSLRN
jgi:lipopolysaccharide export system protein LptA